MTPGANKHKVSFLRMLQLKSVWEFNLKQATFRSLIKCYTSLAFAVAFQVNDQENQELYGASK